MTHEKDEILIYDRNTDRNKDDAILAVLYEVIKRPLFVGLQHVAFDKPMNYHQQLLMNTSIYEYETEIVGSSRDGLKCSRVFSCGDVDTLLYSPLILNESDEMTFEYRSDFPAYFHFPQPKHKKDFPDDNAQYLNPNFLRQLNPRLFPLRRKAYQYTVIPQAVNVSDVKCAITKSVPYSDPIPHSDRRPAAESLDFKLFTTWQIEQTVLAYLIGLRNHKEMTFVRELIYGPEIESFESLTTRMKTLISYWRNDFHMTTLGIFDLIHFDSEDFKSLLKSVVEEDVVEKYRCNPIDVPHGEICADLVPALRCTGWPRPAHAFQNRKRKWPSNTLVDVIVSSGFQIVARGCLVNPVPDKDFILSFSPSEAKLADHLPAGAKTAYCLLKSKYKCAVGKKIPDRKLLKSYHMKTALFWVAENTEPDSWQTLDLLAGMRIVIDFLVECLQKLNLPLYFIPESNLIGDFSRNDAQASISILGEIRHNPANFIQVILDTEWEFTKMTTSVESYEKIRHDRGYYGSFSWETTMKFSAIALAQAGNYPTDEMRNVSFFQSRDFRSRYFDDPLNTDPPGNIADTFTISEIQLDDVDTFVQTVTQNKMDLFNVLDLDIGTEISHYDENGLNEQILLMYETYDRISDKKYGEYFLAMCKLRLKFYGNVFHLLTVKLLEASLQTAPMYRNKDAVYIIKFLQQLVRRKNYDQENVEDLLHYLLYFCHFTMQRHHKLSMTDQMLRSIREFLQDAKHLMTVYFNPRLHVPVPLDMGDKMVNVLRECFPGQNTFTRQKIPVDLPLD